MLSHELAVINTDVGLQIMGFPQILIELTKL